MPIRGPDRTPIDSRSAKRRMRLRKVKSALISVALCPGTWRLRLASMRLSES
jgi:hypothetical protein